MMNMKNNLNAFEIFWNVYIWSVLANDQTNKHVLVEMVHIGFMKMHFHWFVHMTGSRRSSCTRNYGCESQPLVATRDRTKICRDLPVASRNQRVSIWLRVVTTAALSESPVASRNLWLRVATKAWRTETSLASRNLGCESPPSRLGWYWANVLVGLSVNWIACVTVTV